MNKTSPQSIRTDSRAIGKSYIDGIPNFTPLSWSMKDIREVIPSHLLVRNTCRGLSVLGRDILVACSIFLCTLHIGRYLDTLVASTTMGLALLYSFRALLWCTYWILQGFALTGIWVIGHECGHGAFSAHGWLCDILGYACHTFLLTPYFSWKISHHRHHMKHASIEYDEPYIPKTRSDLGIPAEDEDEIDYEDYFGDTPIYTLFMLIRQQILAFPAYLVSNVSGQARYPKWTNHYNPDSVLFTREQRSAVLMSNLGILFMGFTLKWGCSRWGTSTVVQYYAMPWICVNHWFVMITYLQHTDPALPHYRSGQWNFQRGAAATMDREFLGFIGHFFLHDVAHFHVIHHFFPKMPFYHAQEATHHLQRLLGEHYHRSRKPVFQALWDNYNNCQFVEDKGDIVFYKNKQGRSLFRDGY